jgi:hypothetical protein
MSETLSLSIFTIEADSKPLLAFAAKKYQEAEAFCADERVLTKLKSVRSGGGPLCNDYSILRVRLATSEERARYTRSTWLFRLSMTPIRASIVGAASRHQHQRFDCGLPFRQHGLFFHQHPVTSRAFGPPGS